MASLSDMSAPDDSVPEDTLPDESEASDVMFRELLHPDKSKNRTRSAALQACRPAGNSDIFTGNGLGVRNQEI